MDATRSAAPASRERFTALVDEVYEPLQRYVRRRAAPDDVDDVVADTLATLWRRLDDVPDSAHLPWAYAVARRQLANHRRATNRRLRLLRRTEMEPVPAQPEGIALDVELAAALDLLKPDERELVRLWAWEQLEPAEIGVALGVTANAVSIRLHRIRKKLATALAPRKDDGHGGHIPVVREQEDRP